MKSEYGAFPLFVDISKKRILVVGGGTIALRRIGTLLQFTGQVEVAAKEVCPRIRELESDGSVRVVGGRFEEAMLDGIFMALACTDDHDLNSRIYRRCRELGILANNCSDQNECDFLFPSVVKQKELVVGITAGGRDHRKVKAAREKIERILGGNDADYNWNQGESSGVGTK